MDFDSKKRNKRIMVWVSDEEKALLEAKANYYLYKSFAAYIRDAAIYEKVTHISENGKDLIYDAYAQNTKEIKKCLREIRQIKKFATQLNSDNIKTLDTLLFTIINNQNKMLELIKKKLDLDAWQEINHDKEIEVEINALH